MEEGKITKGNFSKNPCHHDSSIDTGSYVPAPPARRHSRWLSCNNIHPSFVFLVTIIHVEEQGASVTSLGSGSKKNQG